jgi:hypothetical protein
MSNDVTLLEASRRSLTGVELVCRGLCGAGLQFDADVRLRRRMDSPRFDVTDARCSSSLGRLRFLGGTHAARCVSGLAPGPPPNSHKTLTGLRQGLLLPSPSDDIAFSS